MSMEVLEFIWQDVSVRDEVKLVATEALLHLDIVEAQSVLPCNLMTLREVINLLELIKSFIQVALARTGRPKDVPFM